jgi:hypothetical protein
VRNGNAANPFRRIAGCGDGVDRFFFAFHKRDQEVIETDIQQALNDHRLVGRYAHNRRADAAFQRHQLRDKGGDIVRRMFAVQHQPVETGQAQHFGADGLASADQQPI